MRVTSMLGATQVTSLTEAQPAGGGTHDLPHGSLEVDLSRVTSKYIGETEKNLQTVFADAHGSSGPLEFDEADALLGKRSEVKDSHDRFANVEVNYLLQRLEEHESVATLTSNLRY